MGRKKIHDKVPTYDKMLIPTLEALKRLGGSGSIDEIYEEYMQQAEKFPGKKDALFSVFEETRIF
ncbi:MAG: hypothetical protein ACK5JS_00090 [Mangrovibacterium sp.]